MKSAVPFLNVFMALFYLGLSSGVAYILKRAMKPLTHFQQPKGEESKGKQQCKIDYQRLMPVSWLKKYTIVGNFLNQDKKYALKEFLFLSVYSVACLKINRIIVWPLAFCSLLLPATFILFEVILRVALPAPAQQAKNKTANQVQSQIEIQSANIDEVIVRSVGQASIRQPHKIERTWAQIGLSSCLAFACLVMLVQSVMTLSNSVSNSGQLNICSFLIILVIDQALVRPLAGLLLIGTLFVLERTNQISFDTNPVVQVLCHQEIISVMIERHQSRVRQVQLSSSPTRNKEAQSPSKAKALCLSFEKHTELNLINMQATKREHNQTQEPLDMIYFTTAEKRMFDSQIGERMFDSQIGENKDTKRKHNKENELDTLSPRFAHQSDSKGYHDIIILKHDPLADFEGNTRNTNGTREVNVDNSPINLTKRKGVGRKKNKRNLKLTGSSPYLQYLPDMLKKVDKFKNGQTGPKEKKIL